MVAVKIPWEFGVWYDPVTIPLNGMSGYYSAKAFVGGVQVYYRVKQPLIVIPQASGLPTMVR